jgi:hypothetical protein
VGLVYTNVIDRARAGPLLAALDLATFWNIARDSQNAWQLVNPQLRQAEEGLPEGARVELALRGLYTVEGKRPSDLAYQINLAYIQGKLVDPDTGEMLRPWPEYYNARTVAWADNAAGTLTLRWIKGIAWVRIVIWLIAVGLLAFSVYMMLRGSDWTMFKVFEKTDNGKVVVTTFGWALIAGGAAVLLAAAPWAIRKTAEIVRARRELEATLR